VVFVLSKTAFLRNATSMAGGQLPAEQVTGRSVTEGPTSNMAGRLTAVQNARNYTPTPPYVCRGTSYELYTCTWLLRQLTVVTEALSFKTGYRQRPSIW
jgi:hypothetical protein